MKNKILIILGILTSLVITYFAVYQYQNYSLKNSYRNNYIPKNAKGIKDSVLVRCNLNIFKPEIADIYLTETNSLSISFHKPKNIFKTNKQGWRNSCTGGTTIQNITFPQLLKMVKKDCEQFKESSSLGLEENAIQWVYSKAETKKEKEERLKIKEEKEKKEREEWNKLSEEEKQKLIEESKNLPDLDTWTDEQLLEWYENKNK